MSHPARLSLRAPPHLPFIQGWPGIPKSSTPPRKASTIDGTLEVRIGQTTIKAKWLRVELRKYESLPPGFPTSSQGETWEHVGAISTLWSAPQGKDHDTLEQGDFKFSLPLPENIPSSVEMFRNTGVRYELVAALCYRQKGGMFKKEASPIIKASEDIRIINHRYHSAWPLYQQPDTTVGTSNDLTLTVQRPSTAFGPGDRLLLTATLKSARPQPFQFKGFECQLVEYCTALPQVDPKATTKKKRQSSQPFSKSRIIGSGRIAVSESLGKGGEKSARMEMAAPVGDKLFLTIDHARVFKLEYRMEVKAVCQGVPEIKMGGIIYTVGPFARPHASQAVNDIGYVEALCPGGPRPPPKSSPGLRSVSTDQSSTSSPRPTSSGQPSFLNNFSPSPQPAYPPGSTPLKEPNTISYTPNRYDPSRPATFSGHPTPPIQGFTPSNNFQRQPSNGSTSTNTTTTTTTAAARPYSVAPVPNPTFPVPVPAPSAYTPLKQEPTSSPLMSSGSHDKSSDSHDSRSKRYSTATSATFGRWDKDLQNAISTGGPGTPTPQARNQTLNPSPDHSPQMPTTSAGPSPPHQRGPGSTWLTAEQEKTQLYADARSRAVVAQSASGASLGTIGMEPPPEYEFPPPGDPHYSPVQSIRGASVEPPAQIPPEPAAGSSHAGSSRQPVVAEYLSAEAEKEQQRKRFEDAQRRVVSGSSPNANPSAPASPTKSIQSTTAGPSTGVVPAAAPTTGPQTPRSSGIGAVSEKEQMRRYFEAQDRVARSRDSLTPDRSMDGHAANAQGSSSAAPSAGMSTSISGTVFSEKEQIRRYYEAQDRVARAADGGGEGSGSGLAQQRSRSPDKPRASIERSPPTALDEKEQMRRYYEARDRVTRAAEGEGGASGSDLTQQRSRSPENVRSSMERSPPMALNEKEQMRRYYEAQDRVARAASGSPAPSFSTPLNQAGPSGSSSSPFVQSSPGTPTPAAGPSSRLGNPGSSPLVNGNSSGPGYMTATEEKEMMRKRFESAQEAVQRRMNGSPSPPPSQSFSASPSRYSPPEQAGYSGVSPLAKEVLARASTAKARQARESAGADGPPPPLPAKPPMEYINLLSPVNESPSSFARWSTPTRGDMFQSSGFERGIGIKMNGNGQPDGVGKVHQDGESTSQSSSPNH